jgi:PEP-CTERM motif
MKKALATLAVSTALTIAATATPSNAAQIVVNQTLNTNAAKGINGPGFQGWQGTPAFSGDVSFDLAEGDSLDYTIDFLDNQSLTANNLSFLWAFFFSGQPSGDARGTGFFQILGNEGQALYTSATKTTTEGSVHFGQQFNPGDFEGGLPTSLTFYGVRYQGTLEAYLDPPPSLGDGGTLLDPLNNASFTTRTYNNPAFFLTASNNLGAVPEPASWALMIAGFGLVGGAMRRRTKLQVTYA